MACRLDQIFRRGQPMATVELHAQSERVPVTNWALIAFIFLCYYVQWMVSKRTFAALTLTGFDLFSLVTYMFMHAHVLHLAWNLILLWFFGDVLCRQTGGGLYLLVFLCCGLCAGLVHVACGGPQVVGSSGAVRGIAGCLLVLVGQKKLLFFDRSFACPLWAIVGVLIFKDVWSLVFGSDMVSTAGHLGGLACGIIIGIVIRIASRTVPPSEASVSS